MSAVMSDQPTSNVAEFFTPGPGERLRAARLSMGYDLAKIASELHLTTPVVEALEADDFSDIGARVFVRGYLRNYARIVGMPVDSILRQFDEKWPDDGVSQTMVRQSPRLPSDGGPGRGLAGAMSWLLLIGLVVLFLMWWRGYLNELVPETMRVVEPEGSAQFDSAGDDFLLQPGSVSNELDALPADGSLLLPVPPSDLPLDDAIDLRSTGSADDRIETGNSLSLPALSAASDENAPVAGVGDGSAQPVTSQAGTPVTATAADAAQSSDESNAAEAGGPPEVVLSFTGPCWVDVRDSEREFKLFGEMPQGARRVLGGTPPYKMVIGNARAVEITVDGKPFDLTPYAKGNVARFTLTP
jgi:cytoskeleton protein RodZ